MKNYFGWASKSVECSAAFIGIIVFLNNVYLLSSQPFTLNTAFPILTLSLCFIGYFYIKKVRGKHIAAAIDVCSLQQAEFLDQFLPSHRVIAIIVAAGMSLFFELVMIRWQGSLFPVFAFYKNFTLLACFTGLGAGYATSQRSHIPLVLVLPLTGVFMVLLIVLRYGSAGFYQLFFLLPSSEQTSVAAASAGQDAAPLLKLMILSPLYLLLSGTYVFTALIFYPIGQLCGRVMEAKPKLVAYGLNLIGSIAGVVAMLFVSYLWTPPAVWLIVAIMAILFFQRFSIPVMMAGGVASALILLALLFPVTPEIQQIYSPYQLIERTAKPDGLMQILSAGKYYQKVYDLSFANKNRDTDPDLKNAVQYYELPYRLQPNPENVAIVGAGSGNDVAAALRMKAQHIDGIEIDPVIQYLGKYYHPEKPYADKRVRAIVDDARTFFRHAKPNYDLIVYGVLDSHTLLSHASNVRVDSFVYTQEGLEDAYRLLKPGGMLSLSFALPVDEMGYKIYQIFKSLPGAGTPVALRIGYDYAQTTAFFVRKGGDVTLPADLTIKTSFQNVSASYHSLRPDIDLPTDDWPFFYMPKRIYPFTYLAALGLVLMLTILLTRALVGFEKPRREFLPFFFLGAGFMLVETKAITELGLHFGNTWYVIAIVIIGILTMAYLANWYVEKRNIQKPGIAYAMLIVTLLLGYYTATHGKLDGTGMLSQLAALVLLTSPMFFSGIVFSTLLNNSRGAVSSAMSYNLLGALLGGLLEYNSMYFGFAFLYFLAIAIYGLGWFSMRRMA